MSYLQSSPPTTTRR